MLGGPQRATDAAVEAFASRPYDAQLPQPSRTLLLRAVREKLACYHESVAEGGTEATSGVKAWRRARARALVAGDISLWKRVEQSVEQHLKDGAKDGARDESGPKQAAKGSRKRGRR